MRASDWYERYRNHNVWARIEEAQVALEELETDDQRELSHSKFLQLILKQLLERRERPSLFVSETMLDEAHDGITSLQTQLESGTLYMTTSVPTVKPLFTLREALDAFSKWPVDSRENLRSAAQAMRHASEELATQTQSFEDQSEVLRAKVEALISDHSEEIDEKIADVRTTFAEIDSEVTAVGAKVAALDQQADDLIAEHESKFAAADKATKKRLDDSIEASTKRVDNIITTHQAKLNDLQEEMEAIKERTADVAALVSTTVVSSAYQTEADTQRTYADRLRLIGTTILVFAVAFAIWFGRELTADNVSDRILFVRFSITFTTGVIGWYLLKESANHRRKEQEARTMELKLRALAPFIEHLPDKDEIIESAAHYFFGIKPTSVKKHEPASVRDELRYKRDQEEDD